MTDRLDLADLITIAAEVLAADTHELIAAFEFETAVSALALTWPRGAEPTSLVDDASRLVCALSRQPPLPAARRRLAVVAMIAFLERNGAQVDLEPEDETRKILDAVQLGDADAGSVAAWLEGRIHLTTKQHSISDLIRFGTLTLPAAQVMEACVRGKLNIVVSGATGTGKTTNLNVLSSFIPVTEHIVTIEDSIELQLQQPHIVQLEARPPNAEGAGEVRIRDLVKNSLRMRPDRIVVGECRGPEALDMLQAMNTGHDGSLTTLHANSARDAISRLEVLVLMAGYDLPLRAIREQINSAIHLIYQLERLPDGRRIVRSLTEVQGMEGDIILLQDIFAWDFASDQLVATGLRPRFVDTLRTAGIEVPASLFQVPRHGPGV